MAAQISQVVRVFLASLALGLAAMMSVGASPQTPSAGDPLPALLSEVHALRMAMEQQASIGPRIQLTLARLNIEEQRVSHLMAELDHVRQQLTGTDSAIKRMSDELTDAEHLLQTEAEPARRRELEAGHRNLQHELRMNNANAQELRTRENDALQALAAEQARWVELSNRLDELDRLLAPVR